MNRDSSANHSGAGGVHDWSSWLILSSSSCSAARSNLASLSAAVSRIEAQVELVLDPLRGQRLDDPA